MIDQELHKIAEGNLNKYVFTALVTLSISVFSTQTNASTEKELKKMAGYTIVYGGYIQNVSEKNYSEKYIQLGNGWTFKMNCLMLSPLNFTDVVVFGKKHSEDLLKSVPDLPEHLQYQFKLLINKDFCDATLVN